MQFGNGISPAPVFKVFQTKPEPSTDITDLLQEGQPWIDSTGKAELTKNGKKLIVAFYKSGITIDATAYPRGNQDVYMKYEVRVPRSFSGETRGLLGILGKNGLYMKGDSTTPIQNTEREIYKQLLSCK